METKHKHGVQFLCGADMLSVDSCEYFGNLLSSELKRSFERTLERQLPLFVDWRVFRCPPPQGHTCCNMASILGINPVAGVATTFKVRFPVDRDLPSRSLVQIHFPRGFLVQTDQISAKRNIDCEFEVLSIDKQPAKTVLTLGHPREEDAKGKQKPIPNVSRN